MADTADVVVIGGGIIGASITYALVSKNVRRVLMIEKGACASGASGRTIAIVRMHYTNGWEARLAHASFPIFQHWTEAIGGPSVFKPTGFLNTVAPEYAEKLRKNVQILREIGINTVALSPQEVKELQPFINVDDIGAAAYEPESGYANPVEAVEGFRRRAQALGARVLEWTTVKRIVRSENRMAAVETSAGRIETPLVVVAAGAWAPRLCGEIGLELPARVRGIDVVQVARPPELANPHMIFRDDSQAISFRPESGNLTLVSFRCQDPDPDPDPDTMSTGLPPDARDKGAQILMNRIPAMQRATSAGGYRAFDCFSADHHPIIGGVEGIDGLYLATAFSGTGFKIAPAVGTCVAELIVDGEAKTADIRPFSIRRFAEGNAFEGSLGLSPYTA